MSGWDDDDAFFATIDVDTAVQQARGHQQPQQLLVQRHPPQGSPLPAAQNRPAQAKPQQQPPPALQQPHPRPAMTGGGPSLRALFTSGRGMVASAAPNNVQQAVPPQGPVHWQQQQQQQPRLLPAGPGQQQSAAQAQPPYAHAPQQGQQQPFAHGPAQGLVPSRPGQHGPPAANQVPGGQRQPGQQQQHMPPQQQQQQYAPQQYQQQPYGQHPQQPVQYAEQPPHGGNQQQQQQQRPSGGYQQQGQQHPPGAYPQPGQHPPGAYQQQQQQHPSGGYPQQQQQPSGRLQQPPGNAAGSGRLAATSGQGAGAGSGAANSGHGLGPLLYVNLELSKDHEIEVKCGYRDAVVEALKRIPGGVWDARNRFWKFPPTQHERIVEVLQGLKTVRIQLQPLPLIVSEVLKAAAACPDDSSRYCHIPSNLEEQLMEFQREGVKFVLKHGGRALIGDEMGLGKTVQAIAVASAYRDEWPVLIVAPSSLREGWADALHRWLGVTADRMHIVHSGKDAAQVPAKVDFLIVSYNFVQKMDLAKRFGVIICDESHYLKEGSSQRTKATVPLVKDTRRAILLSGTPALNKPKEIFQQMAALVPRARVKMTQFGERYCQGNRFDKYGGASNLAELNALLKNSVMVRRLKREVLTQLPKKRRQQVMLDLDDDAKKQLAGLQRQLEIVRQVVGQEAKQNVASGGAAGGGGGGGARAEQMTVITELYNKTAALKAKAVQDYVALLLDNNQKFLVFGHHTCMLDAIEHAVNRYKSGKHGIKFIRIDGSTPSSKRQGLVNDFQNSEDYRVAILSIRAAGTGLTLTAASTVVFAEMTWVPGETIQAEDRAHRIGQASSVNVYFLHARGSIDDLIWQSIQNKLDNVGEAIDGEAQALDARRVEALDKGQMTLATYLTQSNPQEAAAPQQQQQQQQQQQGGGGSGRAVSKGAGKSPTKAQQTNLHSFFNKPQGGAGQQNAQQQQPVPGYLPPAPQQQQQQVPGYLPPAPQQQQPVPGYLPPAPQQGNPSVPPGQKQVAQQAQYGPENGAHPGWQHAGNGVSAQPLHGPSAAANVHQGQGPPRAGQKRPYEGS